jgi:hypothetical protein
VRAAKFSDEFLREVRLTPAFFASHKQQSNYNTVSLLCFEDAKASVSISENGFYGSTSRF